MATLFSKLRLKTLAQNVPTADILPFLQILRPWQEDYHHGSLKHDKETSREQAYNNDIFGRILGYTQKPNTPFTFEPKASPTLKGQLPDAVISYNGENIFAVVELKGASIELDRPQQREGNMSPVQQAFKYKIQYRRCPFVIVSNFYEFRLYQDNQLDYEKWTLDDLLNPAEDYLAFKTWYILLKSENFVTPTGSSKTEQLLSSVRLDQEQISKKFYSEYKEARLGLLRDLYRRNESVKKDIDFGIEKAQKIVDRLVFVCFAEDRGLLPENILFQVEQAAKQSVFGGSLWNALKGFFEAIDKGSDKLDIPQGYNGGLFKSDPDLNMLEISDNALTPILELGKYDFEEEVSVSILGHIFEQSISDLEEIKRKVHTDLAVDSKRKKDGIFYTPDYIVRYIVDNSLGAYLHYHEDKFKQEFGLKENIQSTNYAKRERDAYNKYLTFLQNIKVLDPACGSGAFLVYVFDYLLTEYKRVGSILNDMFSTDELIRDILSNNIFGVDLNAESVEITKLSLWLKTAQKGKKLTSLDANIKCGNSLIDDPTIAGVKAFNWQKEFPEIFAQGGFDVVIGNPPYGAKIDKTQINHVIKIFNECGISKALNDTYFCFYALGLKSLLKKDGILGFISPNTWKLIESAKVFRNYLFNTNFSILEIIQHTNKVFEEATVDCDTLIIQKNTFNKYVQITFLDKKEVKFTHRVLQSELAKQDYINLFLTDKDYNLKNKIFHNSSLLKDVLIIKNGVKPYEKGKGNPPQTDIILKEKPFTSESKKDDSFMPLIGGSSFHKYRILWNNDYWIKYGEWLAAPRDKSIFDAKEKLIFRQTSDSLIGTYINDGFIMRNNTHILLSNKKNDLNLKYILTLLNSKLLNYYYWTINPEKGEAMAEVKAFHLGLMPIKIINIEQQNPFIELTEKMLVLNEDFQKEVNRFVGRVKETYNIDKITANIANFYNLSFADFTKELAKQKIKLSMTQKDELEDYFNEYVKDISTLNQEIEKTDKEINHLVYNLYNLTPQEIQLVETSSAK